LIFLEQNWRLALLAQIMKANKPTHSNPQKITDSLKKRIEEIETVRKSELKDLRYDLREDLGDIKRLLRELE